MTIIEEKRLSFMDRFWYKLVIGLFILLGIVLLDKFNILELDTIKNELSSNINVTKIASKVNGKVNIIDLGTLDEVAVSGKYLEYETVNGVMHIETDALTGVENYIAGVVVKIEKKDDYYTVSILGIDDILYVYSHLDSIDCTIYSYLKTNEIIGSSSEYYELNKNQNK